MKKLKKRDNLFLILLHIYLIIKKYILHINKRSYNMYLLKKIFKNEK